MDAALQRHCARYIYVIPDGLKELCSDIAREVLRSQPENVYTFIADYLDALMITRENARVAARLVESLTEMATTTATFLEETGMPRDEVDTIVSAITKTFKKSIDMESEGDAPVADEANVVNDIMAEIQITPEQAEVAALIIQQAYRRFKERKEHEKQLLSGMVDWRVAARSAIHLYRKTGVSNEEANRAATLIKAAYKGYYTRKVMKKIATYDRQNTIFDLEAYLNNTFEEGEEDEIIEDKSNEDVVSYERVKSVTIDYNTVKPHVDFDTSAPRSRVSSKVDAKLSTASSIAKYSLKQIFDTALERIGRQSLAEEIEENDVILADLAGPILNIEEYEGDAGDLVGTKTDGSKEVITGEE